MKRMVNRRFGGAVRRFGLPGDSEELQEEQLDLLIAR